MEEWKNISKIDPLVLSYDKKISLAKVYNRSSIKVDLKYEDRDLQSAFTWKQIFNDEINKYSSISSTKHTDNPLYTDTRYNDKIRYNDNLTVKR